MYKQQRKSKLAFYLLFIMAIIAGTKTFSPWYNGVKPLTTVQSVVLTVSSTEKTTTLAPTTAVTTTTTMLSVSSLPTPSTASPQFIMKNRFRSSPAQPIEDGCKHLKLSSETINMKLEKILKHMNVLNGQVQLLTNCVNNANEPSTQLAPLHRKSKINDLWYSILDSPTAIIIITVVSSTILFLAVATSGYILCLHFLKKYQ